MNSRNFKIPKLCQMSVAAWVLSVPAFAQNEALEALIESSRLAMKSGHWQQALDFNCQAVTRFGQNEPLRRYGSQFGAIFYHKGICEMKLQKWLDASESFERCSRDFPNTRNDLGNPFQKMARLKAGEAAMGSENWALAICHFHKFSAERDSIRISFPQGSFYLNLAICHYKLGQIADGNENLEIAIRNKLNFPTPEAGIVAALQALVSGVIGCHNEQALLDFIGKNRGALVSESLNLGDNSDIFLKFAGDTLAAGMLRAALILYQFIPASAAASAAANSPAIIQLAALALIHEQSGNVRGAFAAYSQLELEHSAAANRENYLYQLIRTSTLIGERALAAGYSQRFFKDFPQSLAIAELHASGIELLPNETAILPKISSESEISRPLTKPRPKTGNFPAAFDFYQARNYQEAKRVFRKISESSKSNSDTHNDNFSFAAFYELECLRKLGDLDGLASAQQKFVAHPVLGSDRLRQLEINSLWDAVRTQNWQRLEPLAANWLQQRLPGNQRAQVAYCDAIALENLGRPIEALNAYNIALIADAGASEEIARQAVLRMLRIHQADPAVQTSIAAWQTPAQDLHSPGFLRLREAAALAYLFELSLGAGSPLPAEFENFLKYIHNP